MSLIYQALRRLGSETRPGASAGLGPLEPMAPTVPARRPALLVAVAAVGAAAGVVAIWLLAGGLRGASEPALAAASVASSELTAAPAGPPPVEVADASFQPAARLIGPAAADSESQVEPVRSAGPGPAPAPADSATAATAPPARLFTERTAPAPAPTPGATPGPQAARQVPPPAAARTRSEPLPELQPEERGRVQALAREKSRRIARLTASLTHAARAKDRPRAEGLLEQLAAETGADSSYYLNMSAYVALERGDYAGVEALLQRVLQRNPTDADAGLNMAVAESRTGRLEQARRRLEQLALAHPEDDRIGAMLRSINVR